MMKYCLSSIRLLKKSKETKHKKILDKLSPKTHANYYFKPFQEAYTTTFKILISLFLM